MSSCNVSLSNNSCDRSWKSCVTYAAIGAGCVLVASTLIRALRNRHQHIAALARSAPPSTSEIIFMGTGSSTGVPRATCVMDPNSKCHTCKLAMEGTPETNHNWRGNPSILIRYVTPSSNNASSPLVRNIQIDICKTFLPSVLRFYPRFGIRSLDGVILTHEHADAVLGLDDIRSLQCFAVDGQTESPRLDVRVSKMTLESMQQKFPYLTEEASSAAVARKVALLGWPLMFPFTPFEICGLNVMPLPVLHGEDYVSMGFLFGAQMGKETEGERECCLYISDVSRIPQLTWNYLCTGELPDSQIKTKEDAEKFMQAKAHPLPANQNQKGGWKCMPDTPLHPTHWTTSSLSSSSSSASSHKTIAPKISLLVIDALFPVVAHNTHFHLPQALDFIERLHPRRALITGMSDHFEYHRDNMELKRKREKGELTVDVELAYDGMRIPINL